MNYTEDNLEHAAIEIFEQELGYEFKHGPDIAVDGEYPERQNYNDVFLFDRLQSAILRINKDIKPNEISSAIKKLIELHTPILVENNRNFHRNLVEGIDVPYKDKDGNDRFKKVYVIDFENPSNNDYLVVNQFTVIENGKNRRPDLVIFINGIPVSVFELKSASKEEATIFDAYKQFQTYKEQITSLFIPNAFLIISDGVNAKIGTITSNYERFMFWKTVDGKEINNSVMQMPTLIKGMFDKSKILDIIKNFILFQADDDSYIKIIAGYHQYYAVKTSLDNTLQAIEGDGRIGVVWHTQGSGKSLSMVFYTGQLIQRLNNPTIVVITDRNDLDDQLYLTFSKSHLILRQQPIKIDNRKELREKLNRESGGVIFSTLQKFTPGEDEDTIPELCSRKNVIVIADEAHRSHYGLDAKVDKDTGRVNYGYAKHLRDALPNASFIGFTGTPVEDKDKSTIAVFGDCIHIYDMTQSVEDKATVKIFYENRIARLNLDEKVLDQIDNEYEKIREEGTDELIIEKSKAQMSRLEKIIGDEHRLEMLANDFVHHFEDRERILKGKAMIVCMKRQIAVDLYEQIIKKRPDWHSDDITKGKIKVVMTGNATDNEILRKHHTSKDDRKNLSKRMKDVNDELKIVIVVDMWLTGFDVPSLMTMYIDKPLHSHNLMQAIARVNRVYEGKTGGLIVDYVGIMASLRDALNVYTDRDKKQVELDLNEAMRKLEEILEIARNIVHKVDYSEFENGSDRERLELIADCADHILLLEQDKKGSKSEFVKRVNELAAAETICRTLLSEELKLEIAFFKAVKGILIKMQPVQGRTLKEVNDRVSELVKASIQKDSMIDLSDILGVKNKELDIFNKSFMDEIKRMKRKNIALTILENLLNGKIKGLKGVNVVKSEYFSDKFKQIMNSYRNKSITNAEVIEELLKLSKEMKEAHEQGNELGLSQEETAFYDALSKFESVKEVMTEDVLKDLAKELTEEIQKSRTIDWDLKSSVQARMRVTIKRLLKKYDYPPEFAKQALDIVIQQVDQYAASLA